MAMANYLLYLKSYLLIYKLLDSNHKLINCDNMYDISSIVLGK